MACNHLRDFYELYALGTLEGPERVEIETHLGRRCEECTLQVEKARELISNLAYLAPASELSPSVKRQLMANVVSSRRIGMSTTEAEGHAFPEPVQKIKPKPLTWSFGWGWAAALAAIALVVVGTQYMRLQQETR